MNFFSKFTRLSKTIKPSKGQILRVKRGYYTLLGAIIHTCLCLLIWVVGLFNASGIEFIVIFFVIWLGYLTYFMLLKTGINQRFQDPNLTMPIVLWAVSVIMYTVSLTAEIRSLLLMFNLLILVFSAFYLNKRQYIIVTLYGIILYISIILYLKNFYPKALNLGEESVLLCGYVFLASALSSICYKMSDLRKKTAQKESKTGSSY